MVTLFKLVKFLIVDHIVVSVGPYKLKILAFVQLCNLSNNIWGRDSPPTKISENLLNISKSSVAESKAKYLEGVVCIISILLFWHNFVKSLIDNCSFSFANINVWPLVIQYQILTVIF